MTRRITPSTSLDNLKKEAKRRLKALRESSPGEHLREVQHLLAREYGFAGWAALKSALVDRSSSNSRADAGEQLIARFLDFACPDHHVRGRPAHRMARHSAVRILQRHAEIAHATLATAIVCGETEEVRRIMEERPQLAKAKTGAPAPARSKPGQADDLFKDGGVKGWEPLLYLCFARLPVPRATENALSIARLLLDRGADPNVHFMAGDSRYTPLVGVIGEGEEDRPPHERRDELARLLLEQGAEPYDLQVIYNLGFHGKALWFLKLIHELSTRAGRQRDWDDPEWRMLDMGGYGSGARWHLRIAVEHNDLELAEWCLTHGAGPNAAPERDQRFPQRSLYAHAVLLGHSEMAELLARYGAVVTNVGVEDEDAFVAACLHLDRAEAERMVGDHPE